ncbi:MAG: TRAP transporter small permease [Betaproteobacteria bacterium]
MTCRAVFGWLDENFERVLILIFYSYFIFVILVEITLRTLFSSSLHFTEESARHAFIWLTWIAASLAAKKRLHISIDLVSRSLSRRGQFYLSFFYSALFIVFCLYGLRYVSPVIEAQIQFGVVSVATRYPMYLAYAAVPAGYGLMIVRVVQNLVVDIADLRAGRPLRRGAALI